MGRDNVVNPYWEIEIDGDALLGSSIDVWDFDHIHERSDIPIKKPKLVKTTVLARERSRHPIPGDPLNA